ncbi:MAG: ABC transporter permease [Bradymonadaceae bacterium]
MLRNIGYVAKRELGAYFNSVVAYIVVILFLVITGALFWLNYFQQLNTLTLRSFFNQAPLFLAFFAPAITMGLFAEERRLGTLELLMTMPLSDFEIVMGKFLAAMGLLAVVFATTLAYPITLSQVGAMMNADLDWGAVASGYIGLMLLGGAYSAIGLMASSWTRDQVVAILVSFSICFFFYLIDQLVGQPTGAAARVVDYLSTASHFENLARGVVDFRDVFYYLSIMGVALLTTQVTISARRW